MKIKAKIKMTEAMKRNMTACLLALSLLGVMVPDFTQAAVTKTATLPVTTAELGKATVRTVKTYPTRSFVTQGYALLYAMKPSDTKSVLLKEMESITIQVDADEMIRAQEGVQLASAYPDIGSYNIAIHRIERVRDDACQKFLKQQLKDIVTKKYNEVFAFPRDFSTTYMKLIEEAVVRAEEKKTEPYLTEADEAVKNLPFGTDRSKLEARMKIAHKDVDGQAIEKAIKSVDLAASTDEMNYLIVAMDSIDQVADEGTRAWLEQRLFQFKIRTMSRTDLTPYLKKLSMPSGIKPDKLAVGEALNWVIMAELKPTQIYLKKAEAMVAKLDNGMEKDILISRLSNLK